MLVKTIKTKTVFGDKEKILETVMRDKNKEHFLYRVYGVLDGYATGVGRFKRENKETKIMEPTEYVKFSGEIEAVNCDGEIFEAAIVFLPEYISAPFKNALAKDDALSVEFAFDIFAIYSKDSVTSYEYIAQPVRKQGEEKKVEALRTSMPALPGKAPAAKIEDKTKAKT